VIGPNGLAQFHERRESARSTILYAFDLIEHNGVGLRDRPFLDLAASLHCAEMIGPNRSPQVARAALHLGEEFDRLPAGTRPASSSAMILSVTLSISIARRRSFGSSSPESVTFDALRLTVDIRGRWEAGTTA
jgi:hypothetical protein